MSFLLDTNVLSFHLRDPVGLTHRFIQHSGRLFTSSICLGELFVWAHARSDRQGALAAIDRLLRCEVALLDYDRKSAEEFGRQRVDLRRQGIEVPTVDLMIASVALTHDLTVVTHNTADFAKIPGLRLQEWLAR